MHPRLCSEHLLNIVLAQNSLRDKEEPAGAWWAGWGGARLLLGLTLQQEPVEVGGGLPMSGGGSEKCKYDICSRLEPKCLIKGK